MLKTLAIPSSELSSYRGQQGSGNPKPQTSTAHSEARNLRRKEQLANVRTERELTRDMINSLASRGLSQNHG